MSRKDNIRANSDASCKPTREITKNCNKDKKQKKQDKSNGICFPLRSPIDNSTSYDSRACVRHGIHASYRCCAFPITFLQMDEKAMLKPVN